MDYIIVQAGGKGTRLESLTKNKPKALVPVENLPMIFYLFRKYPEARFVIIADYHKEVLREYLSSFADVKYQVVDASGSGTCGGVKQSLELIPEHEPFMLVWSDLILPENLSLPEEYACDSDCDEYNIDTELERNGGRAEHDYVGISESFTCRWKYEEGQFIEECSTEFGVAGFFLFTEKSKISDVPESGELVRYLAGKVDRQELSFRTISLAGTREFGLLSEYQKLTNPKCRPFNKVTIECDTFIKEPMDEQGRKLAKRECAWYEKAKSLHISDISVLPKIYGTSPLQMELVKGHNIYECDLSHDARKKILESLVDALKKVHASEHVPADSFSMKEAYFNKTMDRLSSIRDLVPYANQEFITVNGRKCRNVYFYKRQLEKKLEDIKCDHFSFIHGDCTFSNLMVRDDGSPVLIDPRGYFGFTELYGDERYDWAKLYYSIVGNYDRFNLKKFSLDIGGDGGAGIVGSIYTEYTKDDDKGLNAGEVRLFIESNGWEDLEDEFFRLTGADEYEIKLLHAVIWLSLTTYAWQDYDSICGAFYNGLYYLEEVL